MARHQSSDIIAALIKKIRALQAKNAKDLAQVPVVLELALNELCKLREKRRKYSEPFYAKYGAEEEIIIGTLYLLKDKLHDLTQV